MSTAEIFDRGYRNYDGERRGTPGAIRSVFIASVQRALGLRRKFRFKIVPLLTAVFAYLPAMALVGVAILIPADFLGEVGNNATYADYYGLLGISLTLFTAFVVPELLSTDRQTGLLGMYLAGPLTRLQYLGAKALALLVVMFIVTLFPLIFLMIGYTVAGLGPGGFGATLAILGKIALAGILVALYFTLIGMAVSTLTSRKGFASAGIVVALLVTVALSETMVEVAGAAKWVLLFGLLRLPTDMVSRIYGEPNIEERIQDVSSGASFAMFGAVCAVSAIVTIVGYRRLEVTK